VYTNPALAPFFSLQISFLLLLFSFAFLVDTILLAAVVLSSFLFLSSVLSLSLSLSLSLLLACLVDSLRHKQSVGTTGTFSVKNSADFS